MGVMIVLLLYSAVHAIYPPASDALDNFVKLVRVGSTVGTYSTFHDAYAAALDGDTIQSQAYGVGEDLTFATPISVFLKGGFDSGFTSNSGFTTIESLTIKSGKVTADKLTIKSAPTANGTYTYSSGTLTIHWISSTFPCNGPDLGTQTETGVTITSTTMTWPNNSTTWTRDSGIAGDIVGTWTATSDSGASYTATVDENGSVTLVANIFTCRDDSNAYAELSHSVNGYSVYFGYDDPDKTATSVRVSGPGISGSVALVYTGNTYGAQWDWHPGIVISYPNGLPLTYTFSITDMTGTWTITSVISCYQVQFATNISPTGTVTGTPTFSWTGIGDSSAIYGVALFDHNYNVIWGNWDISGTSIVYDGPALTPGATYNYFIEVENSSACNNGNNGNSSSTAQGSFTYQ
jgi:hypothetical protein